MPYSLRDINQEYLLKLISRTEDARQKIDYVISFTATIEKFLLVHGVKKSRQPIPDLVISIQTWYIMIKMIEERRRKGGCYRPGLRGIAYLQALVEHFQVVGFDPQ